LLKNLFQIKQITTKTILRQEILNVSVRKAFAE